MLDAALRAWRARPAACIGDAIEGLTTAALDQAPTPAAKEEFQAVWIAEAERAADPVRTEAPRARVASTRRFLGTRLPGAIAALETHRVGPPPDADRWLALVPKRVSTEPSIRETELLARIYDDPEEDEARLVYADLLQTRGDPQGELIALQVLPGNDAKRKKGPSR